MAFKIETQKKNPLLKREELWIGMDHEGKATPKRADIIEEVAKHLKVDRQLVIIDKIFSKPGKAASRVRVFVFQKKEDMPKAKVEKMNRRMGLAKKDGVGVAEAPETPLPKEPPSA